MNRYVSCLPGPMRRVPGMMTDLDAYWGNRIIRYRPEDIGAMHIVPIYRCRVVHPLIDPFRRTFCLNLRFNPCLNHEYDQFIAGSGVLQLDDLLDRQFEHRIGGLDLSQNQFFTHLGSEQVEHLLCGHRLV